MEGLGRELRRARYIHFRAGSDEKVRIIGKASDGRAISAQEVPKGCVVEALEGLLGQRGAPLSGRVRDLMGQQSDDPTALAGLVAIADMAREIEEHSAALLEGRMDPKRKDARDREELQVLYAELKVRCSDLKVEELDQVVEALGRMVGRLVATRAKSEVVGRFEDLVGESALAQALLAPVRTYLMTTKRKDLESAFLAIREFAEIVGRFEKGKVDGPQPLHQEVRDFLARHRRLSQRVRRQFEQAGYQLTGQRRAVGLAAAGVGRARRAGCAVMDNLVSMQEPLAFGVEHHNRAVYLDSERGVMKWGQGLVAEEEGLVRDLAQIMGLEGLVPGARISPQGRGVETERDNALTLAERVYAIKDDPEHPEAVAHLAEKIPAWDEERVAMVRANPEIAGLGYFVPNLFDADIERDYAYANAHLWKLEGREHHLTFSELQQAFMRDEVDSSMVVTRGSDKVARPIEEDEQLFAALDIGWRYVVPHVLLRRGDALHSTPVMEAKEFHKEMITAHELFKEHNGRLADEVLRRLTDESMVAMECMGLRIGMVDLHGENLGYEPVPTAARARFAETLFFHDRRSDRLPALTEAFLKGTVTAETVVRASTGMPAYEVVAFHKDLAETDPHLTYTYFTDDAERSRVDAAQLKADVEAGRINGKTNVEVHREAPIGEIPELVEALDGAWQHVFFDLDQALPESNLTARLRWNRVSMDIVPFRNGVLQSNELRLAPYSADVVRRLHEIDHQFQRQVVPFVNGWDRPARRNFTLEEQQQLDTLIEQALVGDHQLTLTHMRERLPLAQETIAGLADQFAEQIATNLDDHILLWLHIHRVFERIGFYRSAPVKGGDTLASVAARHGLTVERLVGLNDELLERFNEGLPREEWTAPIGERLRIRATVIADEALRLRLAKQLHPRISWRQREAFFDRHRRAESYLRNIAALSEAGDKSHEERLAALRQFIYADSSPLNSWERSNLIRAVEGSQQDEGRMEGLRAVIYHRSRPSFLTMAQVQYPLLADVWSLAELIWPGKEYCAVGEIGGYIQKLIYHAREAVRTGEISEPDEVDCVTRLVSSIEESLRRNPHPYLHRNFREGPRQ